MTDNLAEKLLKYPTAIGRFCIVIINNIYCIPTYVVWMGLLLPLKRLKPDAYYKIEGILFHWLLAVVSMWSYTAGYNIVEVGDDFEECRMKKTLVIANHQSTADVPLLMANFNAKEGILPNIMWIMDRLFKYTNFGIVSIIHQDFFIASGKNKRDESIECLRKHIKDSFLKRNRKWMVLFPEGGFLRKRREVSQRYSKKNNLPFLQHVTLPRVGALKAIMDVMVQEAPKSSNNTTCDNFNDKQKQNKKITTTELNKNLIYNKINDNIYNKKEQNADIKPSLPSIPQLSSKTIKSESITKNFNTTTTTTTTPSSLNPLSSSSVKTNKEFEINEKGDSIITKRLTRKSSSDLEKTNEINLIDGGGGEGNCNKITCSGDQKSNTTTHIIDNNIKQQKQNITDDKKLPNGNSALNKNLINLMTSSKTTTKSSTRTLPATNNTTEENNDVDDDDDDTNPNINYSSNNNKNSANCLLEYILDITIAYPKAIPLDLPNIVHGIRGPCTTYMLYRLYKVSNIPKDSEALTKWLYDRFVEKDQLLERFYKTGQFYLDRTMNNGQVIQQDVLRFLLINLFFITSTYFHYQMFTSLYTYCLYLTHGAS